MSAIFPRASSSAPLSAVFKLCGFGQVTSSLSLSFLLSEIGFGRASSMQRSWEVRRRAWKCSLTCKCLMRQESPFLHPTKENPFASIYFHKPLFPYLKRRHSFLLGERPNHKHNQGLREREKNRKREDLGGWGEVSYLGEKGRQVRECCCHCSLSV